MSDEIFCLFFFLPVLNLILFKALGLSPAWLQILILGFTNA